ncbi:MAG: hypothetical protein IKT31_05750 [Firmicutes bacterium]|nr:hypothetical protein [Bacillota bacterium]
MNKKVFFLLLFLAATGMTTGCFFELLLSASEKEELMTLLAGFLGGKGSASSLPEHILSKAAAGTVLLVPAFFLPLIPWIIPFPLIYLFFRGFVLGFSASMVMETLGFKGLFYITVTLIPAELLQLLLFALLLCCSLQELHHLRHRKKGSRKAPQFFTAGPYLYTYAAGFAMMLLVIFFQSVLLQAVTGP